MTIVRPERPGDAASIHALHVAAFSGETEARIVDDLRRNDAVLASFVAEVAGIIVAHVMFSAVTVEQGTTGVGLAPIAVHPEHQHRGIGTRLIRHALEILRNDGWTWVALLGHPRYFPRFGFLPAVLYGLACPWEGVPDPAFMALPLIDGGLDLCQGIVRFRPEFNQMI